MYTTDQNFRAVSVWVENLVRTDLKNNTIRRNYFIVRMRYKSQTQMAQQLVRIIAPLCFVVSLLVGHVACARILFVLPIATQSHKNVFQPLISALAERGHEITVIGPSKTSDIPPNVREIVPLSIQDFLDDFLQDRLTMRSSGRVLQDIKLMSHPADKNCEKVYQNQEVQELLKYGAGHFDLIFFNGYFNQCFYALHFHFKTPFAVLITMASPLFISRLTGNYPPTSFAPFPFFPFTHRMTFTQRLANFLGSHLVNFAVDSGSTRYEAIYRKYLGEDVPSLHELGRNISGIFSNEHFSFTYPKPHLPDMFQVGGMHCRDAKPLPQDLESFISESEHGAVYFSLGSIIASKDLTEGQKRIFINVFSRLKQRVIWKFDETNMTNVPDNLMIRKWLPQQDILGHSKTRLFITHGGLLSTQEAVFHGQPLLGMAIFVDQDLNMLNAESQGYALRQEITELDEEEFEAKVHRLLNEESFTRNAKKLSTIFRDQTETPLERAVFWTEYLIRHKGAPHLRSAARELNYFQLHSWDVLAFLTTIVVIFLLIVKLVLKMAFRTIAKMLQYPEMKQKLKAT